MVFTLTVDSAVPLAENRDQERLSNVIFSNGENHGMVKSISFVKRDSTQPMQHDYEGPDPVDWDLASEPEKDSKDPVDTTWSEKSTTQKSLTVVKNIAKVVALVGLLYFFIVSLDLLGSAFRLIAGNAAGDVIREGLQNPIAGLMVGVLVTVVLQSSSTTTSIIVTMVGANLFDVEQAVFVIMGANIGTTVTSTLVAISQVGNRENFRRAFAGGVVSDLFNWLTVLVLLPIEWGTEFLQITTAEITKLIGNNTVLDTGSPQMLQALTDPLTDLIVQVGTKSGYNITTGFYLKRNCTLESHSNITLTESCDHLFAETSLTDTQSGVIILIVSLFIICTSLVLMVKVLNSMLRGSVAKVVEKVVNYDLPAPFTFLTGYLAILIGAGLTVLLQSSSVFTSTLTPLVGLGVIHLKRMYPLTLGSNIGTTFTGILAALAAPPEDFKDSLQTALCHCLFNTCGVLLWYMVPAMRSVPIGGAKFLGKTTAKYRWFAVAYIITVFLIMPGLVFLLSWLGWIYLAVFGGLFLAIVLFVTVVTLLQRKASKSLPIVMRNWKWLPRPLRSLAPYDRVISKTLGKLPCCSCLSGDGIRDSDDGAKLDKELTRNSSSQAQLMDSRF